MACEVCGKQATAQSILGDVCAKHWEADAPMREAYFAFLRAGGQPPMFGSSDNKKQAIEAMRKAY